MAETKAVRVPETVYAEAKRLKEDMGFATIGEAIRHMCQEGDFRV